MRRLKKVVVIAAVIILLLCIYSYISCLGYSPLGEVKGVDWLTFPTYRTSGWYILANGIFCSGTLYLLVLALEELWIKNDHQK